MSQQIRLGISTCPNDTFAFHALLNREVDWRGLDFRVKLLDIQELNDRLFRGDFDVAKASFHAACLLSERTIVLPSGSALGFGVGPLLLSARANEFPETEDQLTLCPGEHTTAHLLFKMFYGDTTRVEQVVFSDILPQLETGTADFGVCIHEGRFAWDNRRLSFVEDLGARWEGETGCPLPLGGIIAQRYLRNDLLRTVQCVIRDSLEFALNDRSAALPTMREFAQEFDDDVLMRHVQLYVNEWTLDLGEVGANALAELSGRVPHAKRPLEIFL